MILLLLLLLSPPDLQWEDKHGMSHEISVNEGKVIHVIWDPETKLGHWYYINP